MAARSPVKPTGSPSVASKQKESKPSLDKADGNNLDVEIIEVPDVDLSLEEWSTCAHKLKPGQNIDILVTVRNLSNRAIPLPPRGQGHLLPVGRR